LTVAIFGSANIDIAVNVDELPDSGQTIHARGQQINIGGKGANQAVAARSLYRGDVRLMAAVGDDPFGQFFCSEIQRYGLSTAHIRVHGNSPTGMALIHIDKAANNSITVCGGANMDWLNAAPDSLFFKGAKIALFQLETPIAATISALQKARSAQAITIVDPAPIPDTSIDSLLALADIITPNEDEARALGTDKIVTTDDACRAAVHLCSRGPKKNIITLGKRGAVYCEGGADPVFVPPFTIEAIDSVAAGDCFNGALAASLAEDMPFDQAVRFATAASAISVTRRGAAASMPARGEIDAFLKTGRII
jgi:ribokinase